MKRLLPLLLALVLVITAIVPAYATGDGNFDGGGGSMGDGTKTNYWNPGMDGVRVSVIHADSQAVTGTVFDLTNKVPSTGLAHFGKVSKLSYNTGKSLAPKAGNYTYINPSQSLPKIISTSSSKASIAAIRSYFTDEQVIRSIAGYAGMDFDIGNRRNLQTNTILRDVSAINGFLDFVIRKGYTAYKIPPKSLPKENRNFRAYIFTDDEIERMLTAADHVPFTEQNPARKYQIPVMFRILFNCGLRTSELLKLRMCDVNLKGNVFTILDTKFHKNRLVPFSDTVAESLTQYLEMSPPKSTDSLLFPSLNPRSNGGRYGNSWLQAQFRQLLRTAGIPYNGSGKGPRPHDIRHTFAVHCLNNWVLSGEDLTAALPVLSRYLGHNGLTGTQKYLQLTAQMYPDIIAKLEVQFGGLIPQMEVSNESI